MVTPIFEPMIGGVLGGGVGQLKHKLNKRINATAWFYSCTMHKQAMRKEKKRKTKS